MVVRLFLPWLCSPSPWSAGAAGVDESPGGVALGRTPTRLATHPASAPAKQQHNTITVPLSLRCGRRVGCGREGEYEYNVRRRVGAYDHHARQTSVGIERGLTKREKRKGRKLVGVIRRCRSCVHQSTPLLHESKKGKGYVHNSNLSATHISIFRYLDILDVYVQF